MLQRRSTSSVGYVGAAPPGGQRLHAVGPWAVSRGQRAGELARFGEVQNPKAIERDEETQNLTAALERRRWPVTRVEKVMGRNWVAYLERIWPE